ncbi:NAD(P)-binding protein [Gloeopeniophorella convolvens]|nr:NAD(P)-binding protein [Gloeopeniophorella convolvens]
MADNVLKGLSAEKLFNLHGLTAVVTGGGTGIGLMIATTLIANGANVYITGRRLEVIEKTSRNYNDASQAKPGRGRLIPIQGDISIKSEAARLAAEIGRREPNGVAVLFNNAGVATAFVGAPSETTAAAYQATFFDSVTENDFIKTYSTNAVGPYWLTFAFLPLFEKWKANYLSQTYPPQVINIGSVVGWLKDLTPVYHSFPYKFSKSAIGQATAALATELLPLGVRVNAIAPGLFPSEMSLPNVERNELGQVLETPQFQDVPATPAGGSARDVGTVSLALISNWFINGAFGHLGKITN